MRAIVWDGIIQFEGVPVAEAGGRRSWYGLALRGNLL
jgi:hypothetical protein